MERLRWHALLVRPRLEQWVASRLNSLGVETYVPMLQLSRQLRGGFRSIEIPLFPGYVMCKTAVPASLWTIPGVVSIVWGTHEKQDVTEETMRDVRRILESGLRVQRWPFETQGETVMIAAGPLDGISGVLGIDANEQVFIFSIHLIHESIALNADALRLVSLRRSVNFR